MALRREKYVIVSLILAFWVIFFAGCVKQQDVVEDDAFSGEVYPGNGLPKNKKVTVSAIYPVQGIGKGHIEYAIKTFEKRFPNVKIEMRYVEGGTAYSQIIKSLLKAGNDKEMYDWAFSYGGSDVILDDRLEPQDELWERTLYDRPDLKVKDAVTADKLEVFAPNGHIYKVPQAGTIFGIYYNKKLFRENGWNMQPKDWKEFLDLCEEIKQKHIHPMVVAGKVPSYFKFGWGAIPYEIGGGKFRKAPYNYEPDVYVDHAYLMMFKRLEEFARKGYLHPGTISFDHTQSQMEFIQEEAAMIPVGAWVANEMKDVLPKDFEWGFMAFPGNEAGQGQVVLSSLTSAGHIWKNRPKLNKLWAKEFNLWLLNLDIQQRLGAGGAVPARKDFIENKELLAKICPSVLVAMEYINKHDVKIINASVRGKYVFNSEMAKFSKTELDNIIEVISLGKKAERAVREINGVYMRGLREYAKK